MNSETIIRLLECEGCCRKLIYEIQEDEELISICLQADLLELYRKQIYAEYEILNEIKNKLCNMQRK